MDKSEAAVFFVKELVNRDNIIFVDNPEAQEYIRKHNIFFLPLSFEGKLSSLEAKIRVTELDNGERIRVRPKVSIDYNWVEMVYEGRDYLIYKVKNPLGINSVFEFALNCAFQSIKIKAKDTEISNYLFFHQKNWSKDEYDNLDLSLSAFPYCIVTERELPLIKELFFGKLTGKAEAAAKELGIYNAVVVKWAVLYEKDYNGFVDYFQRASKQHRMEILNKIFENKLTNLKVDKWLEEKHSDLIDEVGRDRCYLEG